MENALQIASSQKFDEKTQDVIMAGVIQNFEFTYELCWKFIQRWIRQNKTPEDAEPRTRKDLFRTAARYGLISDPLPWFEYSEARIITHQICNNVKAEIVYEAIVNFLKDAKYLLSQLDSPTAKYGENHEIENKAKKLFEYIRNLSDFNIVTDIDGNYNHLGATIADAVLQANMRYETHVRPRVERIKMKFPSAATMSGLKRTLMEIKTSEFLNWGNEETDRVKRFNDIVVLFSLEKIETEDHLKNWLYNEKNLEKLIKIKGIGSKTIDYFKILTGIQTCAIDRRLIDFLKQAGIDISGNDYDKAKGIINLTAEIMGIQQAYFDHSIWEYIGKQEQHKCKF